MVANGAFYPTFSSARDEIGSRKIYDLSKRNWHFSELRKLLKETRQQNTPFRDFVVDHVFAGHGHRGLLLQGRLIYEKHEEIEKIFLVIEDINLKRRGNKNKKHLHANRN